MPDDLQDEYLYPPYAQPQYRAIRPELQQPQQPRPQQPLPAAPQGPGMLERFGPLAGAAVMAYLNAIASPKRAGVGNAIRNAAVGGVNAYQTFGGMADEAAKERAQKAALGQLPEDERKWAEAGAPMAAIYKGHEAAQARELGLKSNNEMADMVSQWKMSPDITPQQRAAADAVEHDLRVSMTPHKWEDVTKILRMGYTPKPGGLTFEQRKELIDYKAKAGGGAGTGSVKLGKIMGDDGVLHTVGFDKAGNPVRDYGPAAAPKLSGSTMTMVEASPHVLELADRVDKLIDENIEQLGPSAGRWNEFMTGKVGSDNPKFMKLRTDVGLLTTLLMRMHVGARGGEYIMKHFQDMIDSGKQSPENMKAALEEIKAYAHDVQATGKRQVGSTLTEPEASPTPAGKPTPLSRPDLLDKYSQ